MLRQVLWDGGGSEPRRMSVVDRIVCAVCPVGSNSQGFEHRFMGREKKGELVPVKRAGLMMQCQAEMGCIRDLLTTTFRQGTAEIVGLLLRRWCLTVRRGAGFLRARM